LDWWEDTKSNPKKLKAALKSYISVVGVGMGRGKNKNQTVWKIAVYKERVISESKVETRERGEMMWKEQYFRWAESVDGGFLSRSQADHNWTSWAALAEKGEWTSAQEGPKHAPLQLRIVTKKLVDNINAYGVQKELEGSNTARRPSEDQLARMRNQVSSSHQSVLGNDELDFGAMRQALGSASSNENAFGFEGPSAVRIRDQLIDVPAQAADEESEPGPNGEKRPNAAGDAQGVQKKAKKTGAFNAERENARKQTVWWEFCVQLQMEANHTMNEMLTKIHMYDDPHRDADYYRPTISLMKKPGHVRDT